MNHKNYFEDMFESMPDYRKLVLLMFSIKSDAYLLYQKTSIYLVFQKRYDMSL